MKYVSLTIVMGMLGGCVQKVRVEPVTVEPLHVTIDINVHDQPATPAKQPDPLGR